MMRISRGVGALSIGILVLSTMCASSAFGEDSFTIVSSESVGMADNESAMQYMKRLFASIVNAPEEELDPNDDVKGWVFQVISLDDMSSSDYPSLIVSEVYEDDLELPRYVFEYGEESTESGVGKFITMDDYPLGLSRFEIDDQTSFWGSGGILPYYDTYTESPHYFSNMSSFEYLTEGDVLRRSNQAGIAELVNDNGRYVLKNYLESEKVWDVTVYDEDEAEERELSGDGALSEEQVDEINEYVSRFNRRRNWTHAYMDRGETDTEYVFPSLFLGYEQEEDEFSDDWSNENYDVDYDESDYGQEDDYDIDDWSENEDVSYMGRF